MGLASWYDETIVPRLIRSACGTGQISKLRAAVVPLASGEVFEIGCGGGLNQSFYDAARITHYCGVDPSAKGLEYARAQAAERGWAASIRAGTGESLPYTDASFDSAVCTFTLCSVSDPAKTLSELRRVLRPGGRLLYAEHGAAPDAAVANWQRRIEPVWKRLAGGCHLTRPIGPALTAAGFVLNPIGAGFTPKMPRWAGWMEWGEAVRQD